MSCNFQSRKQILTLRGVYHVKLKVQKWGNIHNQTITLISFLPCYWFYILNRSPIKVIKFLNWCTTVAKISQTEDPSLPSYSDLFFPRFFCRVFSQLPNALINWYPIKRQNIRSNKFSSGKKLPMNFRTELQKSLSSLLNQTPLLGVASRLFKNSSTFQDDGGISPPLVNIS